MHMRMKQVEILSTVSLNFCSRMTYIKTFDDKFYCNIVWRNHQHKHHRAISCLCIFRRSWHHGANSEQWQEIWIDIAFYRKGLGKDWVTFIWCFSHHLELALKDTLKNSIARVDESLMHLYYLPKHTENEKDCVSWRKTSMNSMEMVQNQLKPPSLDRSIISIVQWSVVSRHSWYLMQTSSACYSRA